MSEEANTMSNLGEGIREQAYEKGFMEGNEKKGMRIFLNLIGIGMSKEEA